MGDCETRMVMCGQSKAKPNNTKKLLSALVGAFALLGASIGAAQTITVEEVIANSTETSVSVNWSVDDGAVLEGVLFTIQYDDAVFTPDLSNCFVVEEVDNTRCEVETVGSQDFVKIGLLNFTDGDKLGAVSGKIVFNYSSQAALGEYALTLAEDASNTVPAATSKTLDSGKITLQATSVSASPVSGTVTAADGATAATDFSIVFSNQGSKAYDVACTFGQNDVVSVGGTTIWSTNASQAISVAAGQSVTVTTSCTPPDNNKYTATLSCTASDPDTQSVQQTFTHTYECTGLATLPVPVDNKVALVLLVLMILMAAGFVSRLTARR